MGYNDGTTQFRDFGIYDGKSNNIVMLVGSTRNVGIGTTNPTAKLHIGGTPGVDGIKFPDGTTQTTASSTYSVSAGDNILFTAADFGGNYGGSYVKAVGYKVLVTGTMRVKFSISSCPGYNSYVQVYRNGIAVGTEKYNTGGPVAYSEDISGWSVGDNLEFYTHSSGCAGGFSVSAISVRCL